jgi:ceramide glucosyltransferase
VLKPLHGAPPHLLACLRSFCTQDYGAQVQIVLGVQDPDDPAAAVARQLHAEFPDCDIELVVDPTSHGANRKIGNLLNMADRIRHGIVVLADSDIAAPPSYLAETVATLEQPEVGAVTWLYEGCGQGLPARLGSLAIETHFLPNVLVGLGVGLAAPAFGSTIALRRRTLEAIGGFRVFADQLADDHALGMTVRQQRRKVVVARHLVSHAFDEEDLSALLRHELRWARTIRMLGPAGYAGTLITHPFPLALIGLAAGGGWAALALAILAILLRAGLRATVARTFAIIPPSPWLIPLRDVLSFAVFVWSFFGTGVEWGGRAFRVAADGTLTSDRSLPSR